MSSSNLFFFVFLPILLSTSPLVTAADDDKPTAYEVLQQYDFPVGILPKGVTGYELDRATGKFTVHFDKTCSFNIQGYQLRYKSKITGVISKRALKNLSGVQVQVLFLWLNIGEVTRDGDELDFSVGIASADFTIDNFLESPQCGCGFDCVNAFGETKNSTRFFNWKRLDAN
ncbi:hypothetical protein M9H77_01693 [Catharanthus roseus]|uniref:Uncharacterized protein n=1 Tax=Catharanthus roseus TaxID=4058 RepID=A0ACC0C6D3_CATRO|nr:hypothetical protein M9H77_01693 [Catharanthus roseus]